MEEIAQVWMSSNEVVVKMSPTLDPVVHEIPHYQPSSRFDTAGFLYVGTKSPSLSVRSDLRFQPLDPPTREDWERLNATIIDIYIHNKARAGA